MKKVFFPLAYLVCSSAAVSILVSNHLAARQDPAPDPVPIPISQPVEFKCTSTGPEKIEAEIHWDRGPFEALALNFLKGKPESTDKTAPVITSVSQGTSNVLTGAGKINPASAGAPFSVGAADDVAITNAVLYVDGVVRTTAPAPDGLPALFYLRWNARAVSPGAHAFRLVVWDAAGNSNETSWSMTR